MTQSNDLANGLAMVQSMAMCSMLFAVYVYVCVCAYVCRSICLSVQQSMKCITPFYSLGWNEIGDKGAAALADALTINWSLVTLE